MYVVQVIDYSGESLPSYPQVNSRFPHCRNLSKGARRAGSATWVSEVAARWMLVTRRPWVRNIMSLFDCSTAPCLCSSLRINSVFTKWWATLADTSTSTSSKMCVWPLLCMNGAVRARCVDRGLPVQGKATPVTSGKWEVTYIAKLTKDAMWVPH